MRRCPNSLSGFSQKQGEYQNIYSLRRNKWMTALYRVLTIADLMISHSDVPVVEFMKGSMENATVNPKHCYYPEC